MTELVISEHTCWPSQLPGDAPELCPNRLMHATPTPSHVMGSLFSRPLLRLAVAQLLVPTHMSDGSTAAQINCATPSVLVL